MPGLDNLPPGCRFANRCPHRQAVCDQAPPPLEIVDRSHAAACYFANELEAWQKHQPGRPPDTGPAVPGREGAPSE